MDRGSERASNIFNESAGRRDVLAEIVAARPTYRELKSDGGKAIQHLLLTKLDSLKQIRAHAGPLSEVEERDYATEAYRDVVRSGELLLLPDAAVSNKFAVTLDAIAGSEGTTIELMLQSLLEGMVANMAMQMGRSSSLDAHDLYSRGMDALVTYTKRASPEGNIPLSIGSFRNIKSAMVYAARKKGKLVSLQAQNDEGEDSTYEHLLPDISTSVNPHASAESAELANAIDQAVADSGLTVDEQIFLGRWLSGDLSVIKVGQELGMSGRKEAQRVWSQAIEKLRANPVLYRLYIQNLPPLSQPIADFITLSEISTRSENFSSYLSSLDQSSLRGFLARVVSAPDFRTIEIFAKSNNRFTENEIDSLELKQLRAEIESLDVLDFLIGLPTFGQIEKLTVSQKFALLANRLLERTGDAQLVYKILRIDRATLTSCINIVEDLPDEAIIYKELTDFVWNIREHGGRVDINQVPFYFWLREFLDQPESDILQNDEIGNNIPSLFRRPEETKNTRGDRIKNTADFLVKYGELDEYKRSRVESRKFYYKRVLLEYIIGKKEAQPGYRITLQDAHNELARTLGQLGIGFPEDTNYRLVSPLLAEIGEVPLIMSERNRAIRKSTLLFIRNFEAREKKLPTDRQIAAYLSENGLGNVDELQVSLGNVMSRDRESFPRRHRKAISAQIVSQIEIRLREEQSIEQIMDETGAERSTIRGISKRLQGQQEQSSSTT